MKVVSVVGCRPQFVKLAPMHRALAGHEHVIVHTGQHYDPAMSADVFADLDLPEPDVNLGVGSGGHGDQTGRMLAGLEQTIRAHRPDWVIVYGDTNSTLAAALAAVKLGVRVCHVEAGLRSGNRAMPEEHNRILTDHCADLLCAPTATAMANLAGEGLADRAVLTGDVAVDQWHFTAWNDLPVGRRAGVLATIHRPENTDDPERLTAILTALRDLNATLVAHPRLRALADLDGLNVVDPRPYRRMTQLLRGAALVITDSGGLQVEAYLAGTPCITLRAETEWPETLAGGCNQLEPVPGRLVETVNRAMRWSPRTPSPTPRRPRSRVVRHVPPFGDGHAAKRIVEELETR